MTPPLESGEQILLTFNAAFNPGMMKLNKKKAYLTNRRLIFETKPETSIPFSSLVDLKLASWQGSGKIIEADYGQKTKFNVMYLGGSSNEKTEVLYGWIKDMRGRREMPEELTVKINAGKKDFEKSYSVFGSKFDLSQPHSLLAMAIFFVGVLFGGILGAVTAAIVSGAIVKVGGREEYSSAKKWAYIVALVVAGGITYLVLAILLSILFYGG